MIHLIDAIRDFKIDNRARPAAWSEWISDTCYFHCEAMAKVGNLYHTPPTIRYNTFECVCSSGLFLEERDQIRHMVFCLFGSSASHRELILGSNTIGGCYFVKDNIAYITLRGY